MSKRVCSTCKHFPSDGHCEGCMWEHANGNTHWELEELDFSTPKKVVCKLISVDVIDKIRAEIKDMFPPLGNWMYEEGHEVEHTVCEVLADVLQIIDKYRGKSEET